MIAPEDRLSIGLLSEPRINKDKKEVELLLSTGSGMKGFFFLTRGQRAIDMLNDNRHFIPFEDVSGNIRLINKQSIISVRPTGNVDESQDEDGAPE